MGVWPGTAFNRGLLLGGHGVPTVERLRVAIVRVVSIWLPGRTGDCAPGRCQFPSVRVMSQGEHWDV